MRLRRGRLCRPARPHRLPSFASCLRVIICAVLAALSGHSAPHPLRKPGRFATGVQIITRFNQPQNAPNSPAPRRQRQRNPAADALAHRTKRRAVGAGQKILACRVSALPLQNTFCASWLRTMWRDAGSKTEQTVAQIPSREIAPSQRASRTRDNSGFSITKLQISR